MTLTLWMFVVLEKYLFYLRIFSDHQNILNDFLIALQNYHPLYIFTEFNCLVVTGHFNIHTV